MNGSTELSKGLRKALKEGDRQDIRAGALDGVFAEDQAHYVVNQIANHRASYIVQPVTVDSMVLPLSIRSGLGNTATTFQELFEAAIKIHNNNFVGLHSSTAEFNIERDPDLRSLIKAYFPKIRAAAEYLSKRANRSTKGTPINRFFRQYTGLMTELDQHIFKLKDSTYLHCLLQPFVDEFVIQCFIMQVLEHVEIAPWVNWNEPVRSKSLPVTFQELKILNHVCTMYGIYQRISAPEALAQFVKEAHLDEPAEIADDDRQSMVNDCYEILPYFIRHWQPSQHALVQTDAFCAHLDMHSGLIFLKLAQKRRADNDLWIRYAPYQFIFDMNDAKLVFGNNRGDTSETGSIIDRYFLPLIHDHLVAQFLAGDFRTKSTDLNPQANSESNDDRSNAYWADAEDFITSVHDYIRTHEDVEPEPDTSRQRLPSFRASRFYSFMERAFDCRVEPGKGSEIKIWRPNSPIYTLGRHKPNPTIPAWLIRNILKRLGIAEADWLSALQLHGG